MSRQILLLVQIDDATGEVLQDVAEQLHGLGVRNLQILASLGKKGRPGHVMLVDVDEALEAEVGFVLGSELGVWGYRVLESRHRHFDIETGRCVVALHVDDRSLTHEIGCKRISEGGRLLGLKVEHRDLVELRDALADLGSTVPLRQLRAAIETAARAAPAGSALDVRLSGGVGH